MDTGSLFQLRNLINRRNVVTDVTKDLTACEEFMELVTTGHVLAAAIHITGTTDMSGLSHNLPSRGSSFMNAVTVVKTLCQQMVTVKVAKGRSADQLTMYRRHCHWVCCCWSSKILFGREMVTE